VESNLIENLDTVCREFRPFSGVRAAFVAEPPDRVLKGVIGHYGKIKGAPAFIAFIGNMNDHHVNEKVGYVGEGIILEATAMNLSTCWVGALFRPETVTSIIPIRLNERVLAVTPIGYAVKEWSLEEKIMTSFGRRHRRKPLSDLVTGLEEKNRPLWTADALEAARLAPSAVNRQPWRFYVEQDGITISVDNLKDTFNIPKRIDCGIAMLHIEVAALHDSVRGSWEFLEPPLVARFKVKMTDTAQPIPEPL